MMFEERKCIQMRLAEKATKIEFEDIDEYLISLEMKMKIESLNEANIPRAAQLIQRSNQFNLRTQRFFEADCLRFKTEESYEPFVVSLQDGFGEYGIIAVVCTEIVDDFLFVSEFVMSCRVLQRGVEFAIMNHLFQLSQERGLRGVRGEFIQTAKNDLVRGFFPQFNFRELSLSDGRAEFELTIPEYQQVEHFIGVSIRPSENDVTSKIIEIIQETIDEEGLALTKESQAEDIEEWDSLAHVDIIMAIEEGFEISIPIKDAPYLNSIEKISEYVQAQRES